MGEKGLPWRCDLVRARVLERFYFEPTLPERVATSWSRKSSHRSRVTSAETDLASDIPWYRIT